MKKHTKSKKWFEEWFDSPYYHLLYQNRDNHEAQLFINNLLKFLTPSKQSILLDVACGKGRHSVYLEKLGYIIDGFDLSKNSIEVAKKKETNRLNFYVNDIRNPLKINYYNFAFNLFTSFGYFDDEADNQLAIVSIANSLKKEGVLVLDFMNCDKVINSLTENEVKTINNIDFVIKRNFKDGYILKDINFIDNSIEYNFQEKVKAISLANFKLYFAASKLKIEAIFGDYELNSFNKNTSDRLILVARK